MNYDDSFKNFNQQIIPVRERNYLPFLIDHLKMAIYNFFPAKAKTSKRADKSFTSNNGIWEAIIHEQIRVEMNIILDSFFLFEWFPRSPGLYFTTIGRMAREDARHRITRIEDDYIVYDPHGKFSMLQGGLGNVRLKPIKYGSTEFYLMSASSNGECHQGFPVAISSDDYQKCIDQIINRGVAIYDVIGKLKFLPPKLTKLYEDYTEVPQIYLEVTELRVPSHPKSRSMENLEVSVATSFKSSYEGGIEKLYATYVTFDPSNKNSFNERIDWLQNVYVKDEYKGEILTDFDETRRNFANAPFSLYKIMNSEIDVDEFKFLSRTSEILENTYISFKKEIKNIMGNNFENNKNVVYLEKEAQAGDITLTNTEQIQNIDLTKLVEDISRLLSELKIEQKNLAEKDEDTSDHDIAIGNLKKAEKAITEGGDKKAAFEYVKSAGKWVADLASKVGASLITDIIKGKI